MKRYYKWWKKKESLIRISQFWQTNIVVAHNEEGLPSKNNKPRKNGGEEDKTKTENDKNALNDEGGLQQVEWESQTTQGMAKKDEWACLRRQRTKEEEEEEEAIAMQASEGNPTLAFPYVVNALTTSCISPSHTLQCRRVKALGQLVWMWGKEVLSQMKFICRGSECLESTSA